MGFNNNLRKEKQLMDKPVKEKKLKQVKDLKLKMMIY